MGIRGFLVAAAGLSSAASWGVTGSDLRAGVDNAYRRSRGIYQSLDAVGRADPDDRRVISNYYSDVNRYYVVNPTIRWSEQTGQAIGQYATGADAVRSDFMGQLSAKANPGTPLPSIGRDFDSCLSRKGFDKLQKASSDYSNAMRSALNGLSNPFPSRYDDGYRVDMSGDASRGLDEVGNAIGRDWTTESYQCCNEAASGSTVNLPDETTRNARLGNLQPVCEDLKKKMDEKKREFDAAYRPPQNTTPPDPLSSTGLKPAQLAAVITDGRYSSQIRRMRAGGEMSGIAEDDVFQEAQRDCRHEAIRAQERAKPLFHVNKGAISNIGRTLKCNVMPSLAAAFGSGTMVRMATGLGRANTPTDNGFDFNCDPRELDAIEASRPMDPVLIGQKWGVPQLANPPYIQMLRQLPPLAPPFSITAIPGGGYMTPFGGIGLGNITAQSVAQSFGLNLGTATGGTGTGRGTLSTASALNVNSRVSSSRLASSRGLVSSAPVGRGLANGSGLATGTRSLAAEISRGKSVLKNVSTLRSGAANTRKLVGTMSANNAKAPAATRRSLMAKNAVIVRSSVRNLATAKISRTTSEGILGSLRGRVGGTTTGVPTGGIATLDQIKQASEAERKRIELLARQYIDNIQLALKRSEEARVKIVNWIGERDLAAQQALNDMINMSPKKQSERMSTLRRELAEKDKAISAIKAEYDTYQSSILEQSSMVQNLMAFGPKAANYPGYGGTSSGTGRGTNSTSSGTGRGAWLDPKLSMPKLMDWLSPIREAFASTGAGGRVGAVSEDPVVWFREWDKFLKDYGAEVELKRQKEIGFTREMGKLVQARMEGITPETVTDSDTEVLTAADMYVHALEDETRDLIQAADLKGPDQLNIDGNSLALLRQAREEAAAARGDLERLSLQYRDSYPLTTDDNPEAWWALVPELLVN